MVEVLLRKDSIVRLLLVSNSYAYGSGYLDHCASEICSFLGHAERVLFIPFAGHDYQKYTELARGRFLALGYNLQSLHESQSYEETLRSCDAIFIGGGNTFLLLKRLYDASILAAIR